MRTAFALILISVLGSSSAPAQISVRVDPRGTLAEVRVGEAVYLRDMAVSLVKPGWSGNLADQRDPLIRPFGAPSPARGEGDSVLDPSATRR